MNLFYTEQCKRMPKSKAIVKVARKLVNRLYFVLKHQGPAAVAFFRLRGYTVSICLTYANYLHIATERRTFMEGHIGDQRSKAVMHYLRCV